MSVCTGRILPGFNPTSEIKKSLYCVKSILKAAFNELFIVATVLPAETPFIVTCPNSRPLNCILLLPF